MKGERDPKHHHISITPKSAIAILPPKKVSCGSSGAAAQALTRPQVIKALYDYTPEGATQELAFSKGDFFHVISREDDSDWYEACNPLIPSARGLVPVSFFEVIGKNERDSGGSGDLSNHDSGFSDRLPDSHKNGLFRMSALKGQGAMVYGIVQYDFQAERPDELDAKAGEAIIVIAQSNPEWFVAKPIGRLGGPGLIPVSFIELRDMQSGQAVVDPLDAVRRAGVPKVEEWKKMTAEYKNSSITLGKIEGGQGQSGGGQMMAVTSGMDKMSMSQGHQSQLSQNGNGYVGRLFSFFSLDVPTHAPFSYRIHCMCIKLIDTLQTGSPTQCQPINRVASARSTGLPPSRPGLRVYSPLLFRQ